MTTHHLIGLSLAVLSAAFLPGPATVLAQAQAQAAAPGPAYPLKVGPTGRYLVDQSGKPFLIVGAAAQSLLVNASPEDARMFFANRQSHGINAVWVHAIDKQPLAGAVGKRQNGETFDGIAPFTTPGDFSTPNPAYFARVDDYLKLAAEHGITVFLDTLDTMVGGGASGSWLPQLRASGPDKAAGYGVYLGNRYKDFPNIVWMIGEDYFPKEDDDALLARIVKGIKSVDPNHLHTAELQWEQHMSISKDAPALAPLFDINAVYNYHPAYLEVHRAYNQWASTPVFVVDAPYEDGAWGYDGKVTPAIMRRELYWTMLAGGTGWIYGNDWSPYLPRGWQARLDTPGMAQFGHWKAFFESRAWHKLVPDQKQQVVTAGYGKDGGGWHILKSDYLTSARTPDGSLVVAYLPTVRAFTVDMAQLSGPAIARWFDPSNGTYTAVEGSPIANAGSREFTPPDKNSAGDGDWVLVLEAGGTASDSPASQPNKR